MRLRKAATQAGDMQLRTVAAQAATQAAQGIEQLVPDDAADPGCNRLFGVESVALLVQSHQRFLHDILGIGTGKTAPRNGSAGATSAPINITMDARGAGPNEVNRLEGQLAQLKRDLPAIVLKTQAQAAMRGVR